MKTLSIMLAIACVLSGQLLADRPEEWLRRAERAYSAGLHEDALAYYQVALPLVDSSAFFGIEADVRYRIAYLQLEAKEFEEALTMLSAGRQPLERDALLLRAQAECELKQYEKALQTLSQLEPDSELFWHRGQVWLAKGELAGAREDFGRVSMDPAQPKRFIEAQLKLVRLDISQQDWSAAQTRLRLLEQRVDPADASLYEMAFLSAEILFNQHQYITAAEKYRQALPARNSSKAPWYATTLCQLTCCALQTAQSATDFDEVEQQLQQFSDVQPGEALTLALARCLIARGQRLQDEGAYQRAEALLTNLDRFQSFEMREEAKLLRAEVIRNDRARDQMLRELTDEEHQGAKWYPRALLMKARSEFNEGKVQSAAASFIKAFDRSKDDDPHQALEALKGLIPCGSEWVDPVFHQNVLERLIQYHQKVTAQGPSGPNVSSVRHLLGLWYLNHGDPKKAGELFQMVEQGDPASPHAAEALYWAARCAEMGSDDRMEARTLFRKVYENHPESSFADEAYFTHYTYQDYLSEDQDAWLHLEGMAKRFPDSPYLIVAHYLRGLAYKHSQNRLEGRKRNSWNQAIEAFQQAEALYARLLSEQMVPEDQRDYFQSVSCHATLERAQANLAVALQSSGVKREICFDYTVTTYLDLLDRLMQMPGECQKDLLDECRFRLSQAYLHNDHHQAAEPLLQQIVEHNQSAGVTRGYFLARAHHDLAEISMRFRDYATALDRLAQAEEASKGRLFSVDERLELWIRQSSCHRELGELSTAMSLLSKVINDDSVSGLRLKAMLMRAEIYEKQERPELAKKQLIALATQEGEWAKKAKEKLEKDYGYR